MAVYSDNITIKFQSDTAENLFRDNIKPETGLYGLFRGEMAMLSNDEGISLFGLSPGGDVVKILPELGELPGVDIQDPQPGHILVYNSDPRDIDNPDLIGRPVDKWINIPAPRPDLSANSIFELRDVLFNRDSFGFIPPSPGETLTWREDNNYPDRGYWQPGRGLSNGNVADFNDVAIDSNPINGQTLLWDASAEKWVNGFYPENLSDLQDVDLSTVLPVDGDTLLYDESRSRWVPGAVAGGNANVEIIEDESNLPVADLTTLGVSTPEGNFYWNQASGTNQWGKALQAGEVAFDDFKDIDISNIKEGQTLRWSFVDNGFKFLPSDYLPPGAVYGFESTVFGRTFSLSTWGEENAGDLAPVSAQKELDNGYGDSGIPEGLGMFGTSATDGKIRVSYEFRDEDRDNVDSFYYGCLKFPDDLQPEGENNLLGIRPVSPDGSISSGLVEYAGATSYDNRGTGFIGWIRFSTTDQNCVIWDHGHVKISYEDEYLVYYSKWADGSEYTQRWNFPSGALPNTWYYIKVGRDDDVFKAYINGVQCFDENALLEVPAPTETTLFDIDWSTVTLPLIGVGFKGYMANVGVAGDARVNSFSEDRDVRLSDTWPIGGVVGQVVKVNSDVRLVTNRREDSTWGKVDDFVQFGIFGPDVQFLFMQDVDTESFLSNFVNKYVYWSAADQKFKGVGSLSELDQGLSYTLRRAEDVGGFFTNGSYLAWDTSLGEFRPKNDNPNFNISDAEDVNTDGVQDNDILYWSAFDNEWRPGVYPVGSGGDLDDLGDVTIDPNIVAEGHTLLYSEALGTWTTGPIPSTGSNTLSGMDDVDASDVKDGETLAYDKDSGKWKPAGPFVPQVLDDLLDVDTTARPPREGQSLTFTGKYWTPGGHFKGGASFASELTDFNIRNPRQGQALVWDGNYWANHEIHSGRGDGGDFSVGHVFTSFTSGVWGGGDWDTETPDLPMEMMGASIYQGGGDFF